MYINGSDFLFALGNKAFGHSSEHTVTYDTETKERAVKAPEVNGVDTSMFKETSVTKLKITVSFKGFQFDDETELSADELKAMWRAAKPFTGEAFQRPKEGVKNDTREPYLKAQFLLTKLVESNPADDDATYDGELVMTGAPETWTPALAE